MDQHDADDDGLRLDDQLCFALYAATNAITRSYRPLLGEIGLTYPQYLVMLTLWQDGSAPVGRIAHRLELDSHAVSPLVDRLEAAGLVVRRPGADRRQVVRRPSAVATWRRPRPGCRPGWPATPGSRRSTWPT